MKRLSLLLCTLLLSANSFAAGIQVSNEYVRATPPHAKNSAAYLTISNETDKAVKLIAASSDISERVELHTHLKEDGMMKMRQVESILIDANGSTTLQAGSNHIMFLGLKEELLEGQLIRLTLSFDNGEEMSFYTAVKKIKMEKTAEKEHE